jgi:hypothetical protein
VAYLSVNAGSLSPVGRGPSSEKVDEDPFFRDHGIAVVERRWLVVMNNRLLGVVVICFYLARLILMSTSVD